MKIGVIADDITGATDVALMLSGQGGHVVQMIGLPTGPLPRADAVVIALKTRSCPVAEAVAQSLAACKALRDAGAEMVMFKYCSTFDSTDAGNIGPVIDALMTALDTPITVATPAFPANGRTVYRGHLFVGDQLLSNSPMKDHPLTPMRDPDLVAVLSRQTTRRVGLIGHGAVNGGVAAISEALVDAQAAGVEIAIVDAITDGHLVALGAASSGLALVTGGSGIALGLAPEPDKAAQKTGFAGTSGPRVILAGSCSARTRAQVAFAIEAGLETYRIDPGRIDPGAAITWAKARLSTRPILIYSSADPSEVAQAKAAAPGQDVAEMLEQTFAMIGVDLVAAGVTGLIVAGGETSGAVLQALQVQRLAIGPQIAPGVPWTRSLDHDDLVIAAKSGNFGAEDFFLTAWEKLDARPA